MRQIVDYLHSVRAAGKPAVGVGVHNALTARIAERAGFDALWLSGLEVSSAKGIPDINIITSTEMTDVLRDVRSVSALPIFVDADNGYGSDEAALRAARDFAAAGATAVSIEDSTYPKRNSFIANADRGLVKVEDFARRIDRLRAANIEVIARTEALVQGLDAAEAVRRCTHYVEAGADALFVQCTPRSVEPFLKVIPDLAQLAPVVIAPTMVPDMSVREFHAAGADVVIFANVVVRSLTLRLAQVLSDLRHAERLDAVDKHLLSLEDLFELTHLDAWITPQPSAAREAR